VAVVNGPGQCVIAGPPPSVDRLRSRLADDGVEARLLRIPVPAHSRYVEPITAEFERRVAELTLRQPEIPLLSEITGKPLTGDEATSPAYWVRHLRHTVRFGDALDTLFADAGRLIVEVGPGQALTGIVRRHPYRPAGVTPVPTLPHPEEDASDLAALLGAVGQLWSAGVDVDWAASHGGGPARRRVPLPSYPFQRKRYTVDPPAYLFSGTVSVVSTSPDTPAAPIEAVEPSAPGDAPDDVAARVAAAFRQLLGVADLGPDESFFALGGDSVIAAQIVRVLRHAFDVPLPLRVIFRNPTVAGLASYIEERL
jgi:acyl transferase domain-containing protein